MVKKTKNFYPVIAVIMVITASASGCRNKTVNTCTKNNPGVGFVKVEVSNVDCCFFEFIDEKLTEKFEWETGDCVDGTLHGKGVLSWSWQEEDGSTSIIKSNGRFDKGLREGNWKFYNNNGTLLQEAPFVRGKTHGLKKVYHEGGALILSVPYKEGKVHGVLESYDVDGNLRGTIPFVSGKEHGKAKSYLPDGKPASTTVWTNGKEGCITYVTDGRVVCPK